jgi:RNAse (barnase) inhibitor barstar
MNTNPVPFLFWEDTVGTRFKVGAFVAHVPGCIRSREELFAALASTLCFPNYFGHNWDALSDCLSDFSWIDSKSIYLIHDELPTLERNDLKIYIQLLSDSVSKWGPDDPHRLYVVFPSRDRAAVEQLAEAPASPT